MSRSFYFFFLICVLNACQPFSNDRAAVPLKEATEKGVERELPKPSKEGFFAEYENTNRVAWQKPDVVMDLLGELKGKTVADIGTGRGFFALRMAETAEKVIGIDIDPSFVSYLDSIKKVDLPDALSKRLEARLAAPDNPKLKTEELDIALIANTYMYLPDRVNYLKTLIKGIKPGGVLVIIDFKQKKTPFGPKIEDRIPIYIVERELEAAGFRTVTTNDTMLDYQFVVMAER